MFLALHLGAAFIAPLLPGCRVAFPPFLSRLPICLVSACLLDHGRGRFGAQGGGRGKGRSQREGGPGGGRRERGAERETGRQTGKQMAARGAGPGRGVGDPERRERDGANQFPQLRRG